MRRRQGSWCGCAIGFGVLLATAVTGCGGGGNSSGGGGTANTVPVLTSISPLQVGAGSAALTLTANGSNFESNSTVEWNSAALTTTYVTSSELTAQVPASDMTTPATVQVSVVNPGSSGGTSGSLGFAIEALAPVLSSISPGSATVGSGPVTLTVSGLNFESASEVEWNGASLTTTFVSGTELTAQIPASDLAAASSAQVTVSNPAPGGGVSAVEVFYAISGGTRVVAVPVYANDLVWDASRGLIYASVNSADTAHPNTVAVIDPAAATIDSVQSAGTQPNLIAESSDGSYLWVGEDGSHAVQRFTLPGVAPDISIPIAPSATFGPMTAIDLEAAPGSPHTAAIVEGINGDSPAFVGGLYIYDDATARTDSVPPVGGNYGATLLTWVQWGEDASAMYGGNDLIPPSLYNFSVNTSGVSETGVYEYLTNGNGHFDPITGYIYADNGQVVNPVTDEAVGNFSLDSLQGEGTGTTYCAVDSEQGVVFFIGRGYNALLAGTWVIQAYDQKTYNLLRTLSLPQVDGVVSQLIRWGNAGLAFSVVPYPYATNPPVTPTIYLVDGSFVDSTATPDFSSGAGIQVLPGLTAISPQSTVAGSPDTTLTVTGSNFENGAVVYWDGHSLSTQYQSTTQLTATIPASDLISAGAHGITVSDGDVQTLELPVLGFTVTAANSGITALNLASLDVAWDNSSGLLYAPVWSDDSQYPNSIVAVDPVKGAVVSSEPAGPDPYIVRTTADGAYLYSANLTANQVTQFQLPGVTSPVTWNLGLQPPNASNPAVPQNSLIALDVQPQPGASQTTAVATGDLQYIAGWIANGVDVAHGAGVTIYDNNVARPTAATDPEADYYESLQWGANSSTLYAAGTNLYVLSVSSSGAVQSSDFLDLWNGGGLPITYDPGTGYLYDQLGRVIDPTTGSVAGNFGSSGIVVPDSSVNLVFILGQTTAQLGTHNYTITSFNETTFAPVSSVVLPSLVDFPFAMIRWGSSGIALVTYESYNETVFDPPGMLYILNDPTFVAPAPAVASDVHPPEAVQKTWKTQPLPVARALANSAVR